MIHVSKSSALFALIVGCLLLGVVAGCARQEVTRDNYDKIQKGMTLNEVEGILGKGKEGVEATGVVDELKGGGATYVWEDGDKTITVVFDKDMKVIRKAQVGLNSD